MNKHERVERSGVKSAITTLNKQQHEALERATFVGMNAEEKVDYDDRAQRINRLQRALEHRGCRDKTEAAKEGRQQR